VVLGNICRKDHPEAAAARDGATVRSRSSVPEKEV
jgi:hypothetical protein